jgi:nanoRNase/pAp phosphatase (c-di-AMP/oligoRNAs hydrolase)
MKRNIIVGEKFYADVDVLACASAYQELLNSLGRKANSVLTGIWNKSIPRTIRNWKPDVDKKFKYSPRLCQYVLVGVSDPKVLDDFVTTADVVEVYDHHDRFANQWREKLLDGACLEPVGACATLIWEKYKAHKMESKISPLSANLLYTALFASTLDFKSSGTTNRDLVAAQEVESYINLPKDWKSKYYDEVQQSILDDISSSILSETKTLELFGKTFLFGQIELWNAGAVIPTTKDLSILEHLGKMPKYNQNGQDWILNVVSISQNISYFYTNSHIMMNVLKEISQGEDVGQNCIVAPKLWLRKDLLKHPRITHTAIDQ